jgi:hypothetical protein
MQCLSNMRDLIQTVSELNLLCLEQFVNMNGDELIPVDSLHCQHAVC